MTIPPRPTRTPRARLGATGRRPFAGKRVRAVSYDLHTLTPSERRIASAIAEAMRVSGVRFTVPAK